jgi:HPt (histidine-containing phosphotransfer) domain-containing protein
MASVKSAAAAHVEPTRHHGLPPVDHAHLARYTFGNRALEVEVLQLFAAQAPDYLADLRAAQTEKAWRDAAHTLKGSARAVGALKVADCAERVEALRASTDAQAKSKAVAALSEALDEAREHIAALRLEA